MLTHVVIIEVDEEQHKYTPCEDTRIIKIWEDLAKRPCVFLRFNPDKYKDANGVSHKSCFKLTSTGLCVIDSEEELDGRLVPLLQSLDGHLRTTLETPISVEHYFYDTKN
jgi:hypothetical protein